MDLWFGSVTTTDLGISSLSGAMPFIRCRYRSSAYGFLSLGPFLVGSNGGVFVVVVQKRSKVVCRRGRRGGCIDHFPFAWMEDDGKWLW